MSPQRAEEDDEEENLSHANGNGALIRSKLRLGDLSDLPQALKDQLSQGRSDELEQTIVEIVRDKFGGTAAIDEIMVEVYRETKQLIERQPLSTKLYRMTRKQLLYSVPKRKGIYSITHITA